MGIYIFLDTHALIVGQVGQGSAATGYVPFDYIYDVTVLFKIGVSITLYVISIYLYYVSTKIYFSYFDKQTTEINFNEFFYGFSAFIIAGWIFVVLKLKDEGIDVRNLFIEFLNISTQFVYGFILASSLLLGLAIFRFSMVIFIPFNKKDKAKILQDGRFSLVGGIFAVISFIANILTIWAIIKN